MTWESFGLIVTAFVGALGYALKKYFDWRVDRVLAGQLDIQKKKQLGEFEALAKLEGTLLELNHYVTRLHEGQSDYSQRCTEWSAKARHDARTAVAFIGHAKVAEVIRLMTLAREYLHKPSENGFSLWLSEYESSSFRSNRKDSADRIRPKGGDG